VGLIERGELERSFGAALLGRRLVLLSAPAGYGKTAALSRQLQLLPSGCAAAWVTVDEDDDLPRLLLCLAEALEPYDPPWRTAPEALAGAAEEARGLRAAVTELAAALEAIAVPHGVLALDDMHCAGDPRVFDFLGMLIDVLPERWTIAIASRVDPPLALARLGARRELAEFRQAQLGFSPQEVRQLCDLSGLGPGDDCDRTARRVFDRTQGWAAGVCLSLSAARIAGTSAGAGRLRQRHLFDYLATEVFAHMPEELREFLMRCAVLPELTAERCAKVSGNPRAADLLDDIERRGLFVSVLEAEELTLRLHDLFRDFLDEQLRRLQPDEIPLLLQRAAEVEDDSIRKLNLLLRAGEWTEAEQLLCTVAAPMLATTSSAQVARLAEQFPGNSCDTSPRLAFVEGLCRWYEFEELSVQARMHCAAEGFARSNQPRMAQEARICEALALLALDRRDEARALMEAARTHPMQHETAVLAELFDCWLSALGGEQSGPGRYLAKMVQLLSAGAPADLWYRCVPRLYLLVGRTGANAPLQHFVQGALAAADEDNEPLQAAARMLDAWLLLWRGKLSDAESAIQRLNEQSRWLGQPRSLRVPLARISATVRAVRGDAAGVRAAGEALEAEVLPPARNFSWAVEVQSTIGRLAAAADDWPAARRALARLDEMHGTAAAIQFGPMIRTLRAQVHLHERRNAEALQILRELVQRSGRWDLLGFDASVRICLAVAELRVGCASAAWGALAPLLASAAEDAPGAALISGLTMLKELAGYDWRRVAPPEAMVATLRRWVVLGEQWREPGADAAKAVVADPVVSARELEVISLLASGKCNKQIARTLDLSPHTVKRHVARILDRLDLSSRGEVAAWYHRRMSAPSSPGSP
jgi:LuxR family maltose regulon positive regulatory protein